MSRLSKSDRTNDSTLNLKERPTLFPCPGAWDNTPMILEEQLNPWTETRGSRAGPWPQPLGPLHLFWSVFLPWVRGKMGRLPAPKSK